MPTLFQGADVLALTKKVVDMSFDSTKVIESNVIEAGSLVDGEAFFGEIQNGLRD